MKLSKTMLDALTALAVRQGWASAYELRYSLTTMDALWRRGLVDRKAGDGIMFSPSTAWRYRIKESGAAAIKEAV